MTSAARTRIRPTNILEASWCEIPEMLALEEKLQGDANALRVWQSVRMGNPLYDLTLSDAEYEAAVRRFTKGGAS